MSKTLKIFILLLLACCSTCHGWDLYSQGSKLDRRTPRGAEEGVETTLQCKVDQNDAIKSKTIVNWYLLVFFFLVLLKSCKKRTIIAII